MVTAAYLSVTLLTSSTLFVTFDAGETSNFIPVMEKLEREKVPFKVLSMATSESRISKEIFKDRKITLKDLGVEEVVDSQTARTKALSQESLQLIAKAFNPEKIVVGSASQIQAQLLTLFPKAKTYAFVDDLNYDPKFKSFSTVCTVVKAAQNILVPAPRVADFFKSECDEKELRDKTFRVVGKPALEAWEKEINGVNIAAVTEKLGVVINDKPLIVFIGGYGEGYDVINPLFKHCKETLNAHGYPVIIQPHPKMEAQKITTVEALALCKATKGVVIGYNSSVPFDAKIIGINALYMLPVQAPPYSHFAISEGFVDAVKTYEDLLTKIEGMTPTSDLKAKLKIPFKSVEIFFNIITGE